MFVVHTKLNVSPISSIINGLRDHDDAQILTIKNIYATINLL